MHLIISAIFCTRPMFVRPVYSLSMCLLKGQEHCNLTFRYSPSQYRKVAHFNVTHRRRQNFYALPSAQWQMLAAPPFNILETLETVDDAIDANADIACLILDSALQAFGIDPEAKDPSADWRCSATSNDLNKARSTIRQLYRDWSAEGAEERATCYNPVLEAVDQAFDKNDRSFVKLLVPGAGLGRLVFEFCMRGYAVEGNEISYHQLAASNWVLNHTDVFEQYELYPFALDFSNVISRKHQLKSVFVPDVHAGSELQRPNEHSSIPANERMDMTAADFLVLYSDEEHRERFDAIVTVYFLDTAPNVIRYIETIYHCLKAGGVWVNLGPLLWHFAEGGPGDMSSMQQKRESMNTVGGRMGVEEPGSVELSNEELLMLLERMGFEIVHHEIRQDGAGYIQNPKSLLQNIYKVTHWIAKKRALA